MTKKITEMEIIFRHEKKAEGAKRVEEAFDVLFNEVYRIMREKPIVATK